MSGDMIEINGWPVYYEKFGSGSDVLLLIPGAIGTGRSDFLPQLEGSHALDLQKYTLIAIELPGWGRSRPPERAFDEKVYSNDAMIAIELMDKLGFSGVGYSVIGWSYGAKVALMIAMKNLPQIKCVVVMSVVMKLTPSTDEVMRYTQDTYDWPKDLQDNYLRVYAADQHLIQKLWSTHVEAILAIHLGYTYPNGCWTEDLESIHCPVLILQGDLDKICSMEDAMYVEKQVSQCVLHRFKGGGHNFHHKYPAAFKTVVEHFLGEFHK